MLRRVPFNETVRYSVPTVGNALRGVPLRDVDAERQWRNATEGVPYRDVELSDT